MNYIIREATVDDIPRALELVHEFHEEALNKMSMICNDDVAKELMPKLVDTTLVLEIDGLVVGLITGFITNYFIGIEPLFQELMWFVSKKYRRYGIKLLEALENKCRNAGIKQIVAGYMGDRKVKSFDKLFTAKGYQLQEVQYLKNL